MILFAVTIEYTDGNTVKLSWDSWDSAKRWIEPRLDSDHEARQVKRVTICPTIVP
jgi:hypothetical protein